MRATTNWPTRKQDPISRVDVGVTVSPVLGTATVRHYHFFLRSVHFNTGQRVLLVSIFASYLMPHYCDTLPRYFSCWLKEMDCLGSLRSIQERISIGRAPTYALLIDTTEEILSAQQTPYVIVMSSMLIYTSHS